MILLSRVNLAARKIRFVLNGGVSEPFAICQIYDILLLFYSTFSFCAIIGVKDRTLLYKLRSVQNTGTCYPGQGWFVRNLG